MAIGASIRKLRMHARGASCSARDHPFSVCVVFILLIMYSYFPTFFSVLLVTCPVILCTTILLGVLLSYSVPNVLEIEEEDKRLKKILYPKGDPSSTDIEGHPITNFQGIGRPTVEKAVGPTAQADASEKKLIREREYQRFPQKEPSIDKLGEDLIMGGEKKTAYFKAESGKPPLGTRIDSSLGSQWQPVNHHDASSDSESGHVEMSSPDASDAEIIPTLDELHPLLDSELPQPSLASKDGSYAASTRSSQDHESDDCSIEGEIENQEDEEDEEVDEEKDDAKVVGWTADDQRNLLDVGSSEIERNQRLENSITRHRVRKFIRSEMEKNLIDLDVNESLPSIEELSRFNIQIPSIFAPRKNPFDFPFDADEMPDSAPSVLLPARNPFDLSYDPVVESSIPASDSSIHQVSAPIAQRNVLFKRHESFTIGAPFLGDLKQEQRSSRFKPYFVAEKMMSNENYDASLESEFSEKSDSKLNSALESDTASSINDQECYSNQVGDDVQQKNQSPAKHGTEPPKPESESSEEDDSVHNGLENAGTDATEDGVYSINDIPIEEAEYIIKAYQEVTGEHSKELTLESSVSDDKRNEASGDKYDSFSSSVETSEKDCNVNNHEQIDKATEHTDESHTVDPVYDSSPSAHEKSLSNVSAFDDTLFSEGKGGSDSCHSASSGTQPGFQDSHPPLKMDLSASAVVWTAPSLACVEENESRSRAISEIREHDVISDDLCEVHEDFGHPVVLALPGHVTQQPTCNSNLPSMGTESSDGSSD